MRSAAALLAVIAAAAGPSVAAATGGASLTQPVRGVPTFAGTGFAAGPVTVTLTVNGSRLRRTVEARPDGGFTVRFGLVAIDPCRGALTVAAVAGNQRAVLRRACRRPSLGDTRVARLTRATPSRAGSTT